MKVKFLVAVDLSGRPHILEWIGKGVGLPELDRKGLDPELFLQVWMGEKHEFHRDGEVEEHYEGSYYPLTDREWTVIRRGHSSFFEECP